MRSTAVIRKTPLAVALFILMAFIASVWMMSFHKILRMDESVVEAYIQSSDRSSGRWLENSRSFSRRDSRRGLPDGAVKGSVSCEEAKDLVRQGKWIDPNEDRVYLRKLSSKPSFFVSVHNQSYDAVRWNSIFEEGRYYEDQVHQRFLEILSDQPKSLVIDVGANIGYYTLLSASLGHDVLAFEINPANILRICESLTMNGWTSPQVSTFQNGVSDTHGSPLQVLVPKNPGQAFMNQIDDIRGLHRIQNTNTTSSHHAFTTTVTLDQFARDHGWFSQAPFSISILKLDVEGKEPQVIRGAKRLLKSGQIMNILTEFRRLGREPIQEAITTLLESGYTLVHEEKGKLSQAESKSLLQQLTEQYKGKARNFDFWFQFADD